MPLRSIVLTCFFLFVVHVLSAQHSYHIRQLTTNDGLPQNSVTGIVFDKAGYCWLGTEMGLVRFDGNRLTVFNSTNVPEIYSPRIRFCSSDNEGNVYMQAEKGELIRISMGTGQSAPHPEVVGNRKDWLWNSSHVPVFVAQKYNKHIPSFSAGAGYTYLLPSNEIYCVDGNKLYYLKGESVMRADTTLAGERDVYLGTGDCFIALEKDRPVKWWRKGQRQKDLPSIPGDLQKNKEYMKGRFQCFYQSGQAYIYAGGSLYAVHDDHGILNSTLLLADLDIKVASAVYYNREQNKYYIGSLVSGLYIISPSQFTVLGNKPEIISKSFFGQAMRDNGDIICQRFLYTASGEVRELSLNPEVGATLWLDKNRYLYYGNEPALFCYDLTLNTNRMVAKLDSRPSSIFPDHFDSSSLIVGTSFAIGKFHDGSMHGLRRLPGNDEIISVTQSGKDSFIIATKSGVRWLDLAHNKIYKRALDSVYIRHVYQDKDHNTWIATYGRGFYLLRNAELFSFRYPRSNALNTVHSFIEDDRGNFWLPTNNGLFVVKKNALLNQAAGGPKDIYFYMYSTQDNLPTNEFNGGCTPSFIKTIDGGVSIPSIAGLIKFDPLRLNPLFPDKKIYAEECILNDSVVLPGGNFLSLAPDYGKLSVRVSSPYFGNAENLQLQYMIRGLDNNWQPAPSSNEILLHHIPPGEYQLLVRKTNALADEEQSFSFSFSVNPWFYNTWWFYTLTAFAVCACALLYVRLRTKMLRERNTSLQAIIKAQTADLSATVDQLQASEEALKESNLMKDRVTTMVLHDLRSPIRFLHTISDQLLKKHGSMTGEEMRRSLDILQSSTSSLDNFTGQFFTWAASQHQDFRIVEETFALQPFFDELNGLYSDILKTENKFLVIKPTGLDVHTDRHILSAIIRNLLDNAGKNTIRGSITLSARETDQGLVEISVADTGPGMSENGIADFLNGGSYAGGTGNGSIIIINLLEKIGGKLFISSEPGRGTRFSVELSGHRSGQSAGQADQAQAGKTPQAF